MGLLAKGEEEFQVEDGENIKHYWCLRKLTTKEIMFNDSQIDYTSPLLLASSTAADSCSFFASLRTLAFFLIRCIRSPAYPTISDAAMDNSTEITTKDLKEKKKVVEEAENGSDAPANRNANEENGEQEADNEVDEEKERREGEKEEEEDDGEEENGDEDEEAEAAMDKRAAEDDEDDDVETKKQKTDEDD
ncbi:prothymosin alpha-like [Pteropus vampyrus]|uniref:Prothymosin alpha n=1 Tax=Pteropus vampyrus TaxID=132908 RepID=A0A6P3S3L0_PTEVA|nr:prothymosin alpha-like [Pteropus vampyrus]